MNKKDGFVAKFDDTMQSNYYSMYVPDSARYNKPDCYAVDSNVLYQTLPLWRYSSHATAEFISENHADLLDIYLERN